MSALTTVVDAAQTLWSRIPAAPAWLKVLEDAKADYILHGALVYVLMQPLLSYIFAKRERYTEHKFAWKTLMTSYNLGMCLYSLVTAIVSIHGLVNGGGVLTGREHLAPNVQLMSVGFFYSKYVEYLDTIFLIVAGKPVSFLQYFHHLGAPLDMWILTRYENPATWIFVSWNSIIHTLMYAYYAGTIQGINLAAIKWLMTFLQIIQLFFGTALSTWYPLHAPSYKTSPEHNIGWFISTFYTVALVVLFTDFFLKSYLGGKKKAPGAAAAAAEKKQK